MYPMVIKETDEEITYQPCAKCSEDAMVEHEGKGVCREHYLEAIGGGAPLDYTTVATIQDNGDVCCQTCGSWTVIEDMVKDGQCPLCRGVGETIQATT